MLPRPALLWLGVGVATVISAVLAAVLLLPTTAAVVRPPLEPAAGSVPAATSTTLGLSADASQTQRLYVTALLALDCRQRAQEPAPSAMLPPGSDEATNEDAKADRLAEQRRRVACRGVAQIDDAQAEAMLRTAAVHGDADAQRYLLKRRVEQLAARAVAADGQLKPLSAADQHDAEDVVRQLEDRALNGDRQSIDALAQLLASPWLTVADPPYAAAWELAARQAPERPFPPPEQLVDAEELLDGLNEAQRQQALSLASGLFAQCCARH
ncbi:hypothetical protein [Xanthomonas sp. MUS 060]|uniref:hypothetical protein n=1 Tax=Xanthomonas sp. MUS 060 TaxID=1588031 RepID=UPI000698D19A|nr:hypothetical protein [Xanthomonas sp. MUS 060]